ncbi:MAG: molybdopterin-dependent oxidoreductase [Oligoflexia bacterium]|nr:molybdopterin-dependent oxidoreductase [Oligoflexia bacterium]
MMSKPALRHPRWTRWAHWLNFPLTALLVWSGVLIYWANDVYPPFFPEAFYNFFRIDHRLAEGMALHFTFGWLFALNGLIYFFYMLASGRWREFRLTRSWPREASRVLLHELGFRVPLPSQGKYNAAQKFAYSATFFMGAGSVLSGLAIYKPVQLHALVRALGGYDGARSLHFCLTLGFCVFFLVHVIQVARAGWRNFQSMVTGQEHPSPSHSRRSFLAAGVSVTAALWGWSWLGSRSLIDGIPWPLRRVLELNGHLWQALFDPARLGERPPLPPRGRKVRLNGELGLLGPLSPAEWRLELHGPAGELLTRLTLAQIRALPRTETTSELKCIEGWKEDIGYAGVRFSDLLSRLSLARDYRFVGLETPDREYYVSLDRAAMLHPQTLLAYELNGEPLTPTHGAPLRLLIPVKYGIKSLKRIGRIRLARERPPDYWAERGYDWYAGL